MALRLQRKRLVWFSRQLDTVMEVTAEIEDNNTASCFDSASPQKPMATSNGDQTRLKKTLRRERIALFSAPQMYVKSEESELMLWNSGSFYQCAERSRIDTRKNEETKRLVKENSCEGKQKDCRNSRDMKQVEGLFPEFFSSGTNAYFVQRSNCCDKQQKEIDLVNTKVKEDPLIRSWLNLFGAQSCI